MTEENHLYTENGKIFYEKPGGELVEVDADEARIIAQGGLTNFMQGAGEGMMRLPYGADALMGGASGAASRETLGQFDVNADARALASPFGNQAGNVAGYIPDLAAGVMSGGTTMAARVAAGVGVEAGLGAVRNPDDPIRGAAVQGAAGGLGVGAMAAGGAAAGAISRRMTGGASEVAGKYGSSKGASLVETAGPGSRFGHTTGELKDADQAGFLARTLGLGDNPPDAAVVNKAEELGFRLTPGDRLGGVAAKNIESTMQSNPSAKSVFTKQFGRPNQNNLNNLARRSIGLDDGDSLGPSDLGDAATQIGKGYAKLEDKLPDFAPSDAIPADIFDGVVQKSSIDNVQNMVDDIPTETITGKQYFQLMNKLKKTEANMARQGDIQGAEAVERIADAIEAAAFKEAPPAVQATLTKLRNQYRNMKLLEKNSAITEEGDVSLMALRSNYKTSKFTAQQYKRGGSYEDQASDDLMQGVRTMSQFRERLGDSGTAARSMDWLDPKAWLARPAAEGYLKLGANS